MMINKFHLWNSQFDRKNQLGYYSKHRLNFVTQVEKCSELIDKRHYLDDMKPFSYFFTLKNVSVQLSKALLIPANTVMFEYNTYLMEDSDDEFDWIGCINRNLPSFASSAKRCFSVSFMKTLFETIIQTYLSPKYCDKLSKDLSKSMLRKCIKFSRFRACQKIFFTAMWGNAIYLASCFLYDTIAYMSSTRNKSVTALQSLRNGSVWITKKLGYFSLSLVSSSLGFAIGAYFNVSIIAPLCSGLLDIGTSMGCSILVGDTVLSLPFTGVDTDRDSSEGSEDR